MMYANSIKTVMGGLSLLLVLTACASGSKTRTAADPPFRAQETVADRPVMADGRMAAASERALPSDRVDPAIGIVTGCSSRVDANGNIIYDDPSCPTRNRRQHGELAAACSPDSSYMDADGKLVYEDPNNPDRHPRPMASTSDDVQYRANYDRQMDAAVTHVLKAEVAGDGGNIPEMLRHTRLSLDQAKEAQRARTDPYLNSGIMDLKETLVLGCRDHIAPSALRDARAKLSRAAHTTRTSEGITTGGLSTRTVRGELVRDQNPARTDGGEHYMLRDRQNRELPISLSPEMSRQVSAGDTVEAQIDSRGQVVAISKSE